MQAYAPSKRALLPHPAHYQTIPISSGLGTDRGGTSAVWWTIAVLAAVSIASTSLGVYATVELANHETTLDRHATRLDQNQMEHMQTSQVQDIVSAMLGVPHTSSNYAEAVVAKGFAEANQMTNAGTHQQLSDALDALDRNTQVDKNEAQLATNTARIAANEAQLQQYGKDLRASTFDIVCGLQTNALEDVRICQRPNVYSEMVHKIGSIAEFEYSPISTDDLLHLNGVRFDSFMEEQPVKALSFYLECCQESSFVDRVGDPCVIGSIQCKSVTVFDRTWDLSCQGSSGNGTLGTCQLIDASTGLLEDVCEALTTNEYCTPEYYDSHKLYDVMAPYLDRTEIAKHVSQFFDTTSDHVNTSSPLFVALFTTCCTALEGVINPGRACAAVQQCQPINHSEAVMTCADHVCRHNMHYDAYEQLCVLHPKKIHLQSPLPQGTRQMALQNANNIVSTCLYEFQQWQTSTPIANDEGFMTLPLYSPGHCIPARFDPALKTLSVYNDDNHAFEPVSLTTANAATNVSLHLLVLNATIAHDGSIDSMVPNDSMELCTKLAQSSPTTFEAEFSEYRTLPEFAYCRDIGIEQYSWHCATSSSQQESNPNDWRTKQVLTKYHYSNNSRVYSNNVSPPLCKPGETLTTHVIQYSNPCADGKFCSFVDRAVKICDLSCDPFELVKPLETTDVYSSSAVEGSTAFVDQYDYESVCAYNVIASHELPDSTNDAQSYAWPVKGPRARCLGGMADPNDDHKCKSMSGDGFYTYAERAWSHNEWTQTPISGNQFYVPYNTSNHINGLINPYYYYNQPNPLDTSWCTFVSNPPVFLPPSLGEGLETDQPTAPFQMLIAQSVARSNASYSAHLGGCCSADPSNPLTYLSIDSKNMVCVNDSNSVIFHPNAWACPSMDYYAHPVFQWSATEQDDNTNCSIDNVEVLQEIPQDLKVMYQSVYAFKNVGSSMQYVTRSEAMNDTALTSTASTQDAPAYEMYAPLKMIMITLAKAGRTPVGPGIENKACVQKINASTKAVLDGPNDGGCADDMYCVANPAHEQPFPAGFTSADMERESATQLLSDDGLTFVSMSSIIQNYHYTEGWSLGTCQSCNHTLPLLSQLPVAEPTCAYYGPEYVKGILAHYPLEKCGTNHAREHQCCYDNTQCQSTMQCVWSTDQMQWGQCIAMDRLDTYGINASALSALRASTTNDEYSPPPYASPHLAYECSANTRDYISSTISSLKSTSVSSAETNWELMLMFSLEALSKEKTDECHAEFEQMANITSGNACWDNDQCSSNSCQAFVLFTFVSEYTCTTAMSQVDFTGCRCA